RGRSFLFSNFLPMAATSLPPTLTESFIFGQRRVGKRSRQRKWRTRRHETDRGRGCRQIPWRKPVRYCIMAFIIDVTLILQAAQQGDPEAASELLPLVYEELRKLAAAKMAHEAAGQTLQPTA